MTTMRICKKCGIEKDFIQFDFHPKSKRIDKYRRWICIDCFGNDSFENLEGEEWVNIENTNGKYQVSSFRRFRSFCVPGTKQIKKIPTIIKKGISKTGYYVVTIYINYKPATKKSHHLFAKSFIPNPKNLPEVNHINGDPLDDRKENLEWSTHADNMRHAFRTGLIPIGEDRKNRKLTREQALAIFNSNKTRKEISDEFKISNHYVCEIKKGIYWRSLHKTKEELYKHTN